MYSFRLHFEARSPSPSSNFDYQTLPYIEHADHTLPAAAMGGMGRGAPANYQPIGASELRLGRLPSSSEYREEAFSFSTLPTSQFVLKPSSLAVDLGDQQHSLLMHNGSCIDATLEPYSWSWVRNAHVNPLHLRRTTTDHGSSGGGVGGGGASTGVGGNYHPLPSSAPLNYHHQIGASGGGGSGSNVTSSSPHYHHHQHALGSLPSANEPRDISRSSLSVTNSKTIILSNAPVSHAPPTATPTPSTASGSSTTNASASTASVSKTTPVVVPSKAAGGNQSQLQAQQLATARKGGLSSKSSPNNALLAQQRQDRTSQQPQGQPSPPTKGASTKKEESKTKQQDGGSNKVHEKKSATPPTQKSVTTTQKSGSLSSSGGQSSTADSAVSTPPKTTIGGVSDASPVKGDSATTDGAVEPMDTSSPSLSGPPRKTSESAATNSQLNGEKLKSSESRSSVKKAVEDGGESSKAVSVWMVGKPSASILQLSRPRRKREQEEEKNDDDDDSSPPKTKVRRTLVASAEAALLISSQFAQQIVKKEDTTSQPLTVTHALNSAVMGIAGARNAAVATAAALSTAGLPMSTADAISHNITKIPLSLAATASSLPAMQTAAKQLLALDAIQPLQQQNQQIQHQQQPAVVPPAPTPAPVVNSVPDGIGGHLVGALVGQDKKATAVVNAVSASGQAQALPPQPATNLAVRRSSAGTNGTNSYQEIFHTERVKQALAG